MTTSLHHMQYPSFHELAHALVRADCQDDDSPLAAEELGYCVRKGEKAIRIFAKCAELRWMQSCVRLAPGC
jgi:hypothetical protein